MLQPVAWRRRLGGCSLSSQGGLALWQGHGACPGRSEAGPPSGRCSTAPHPCTGTLLESRTSASWTTRCSSKSTKKMLPGISRPLRATSDGGMSTTPTCGRGRTRERRSLWAVLAFSHLFRSSKANQPSNFPCMQGRHGSARRHLVPGIAAEGTAIPAQRAHLAGHDDAAALGDVVAPGAQAVAVQRGSQVAAVGERHLGVQGTHMALVARRPLSGAPLCMLASPSPCDPSLQPLRGSLASHAAHAPQQDPKRTSAGPSQGSMMAEW